ncbi:MAG: TonB-dependent receptor [Sphingomonas sp. 28-66-16]|nr:MAG: TonB-dependent receptor [Sphingomonas sp. 28-66-16]
MRLRYLRHMLPVAVMAAASPVIAQQTPATPDTLEPVSEPIIVTANRTAEPLSRVGQSVTVIDAATINTRQTDNVADLLRTVPGVAIARNGNIGSATSVFIRGAESDQTVALIDGVKITDPGLPGGGFNFGNLLVGNIERIEVLRGPSSVIWGSQAIGGVINLITIAPTGDFTLNARGEYGYRGTGQLVANVSGKAGPLSASAGGGWFTTAGISAFNEARGGKERDGYRNYGANLKLNLALSDAISIDARGYYSDGRVDQDGFAPPTYGFGDTREFSLTREIVGDVGGNVALFDGRFRNRFGYAYTDTNRRSENPDGFTPVTLTSKGRNERFEYQGVVDLMRDTQATFGLERENSRFDQVNYGTPTGGRARLDSIYGQIVTTPLAGLTLTGGIRRDDHDRFGGATSIAASGVYSPNAGRTTIRASYSEGFKAPSLYQLQGDYGNQQLRPERAKGWDAGITQRLLGRQIEASVTYFHRTSTDLIDFIACAAPLTGICTNRPFGTYDNVARATAQGVEATLVLRPTEPLELQANYSWLDARNRSPGSVNIGNRLARRPSQSVNASIDYRWPFFGLSTGATVTHVGSSFDNAANTRRNEGYVLADIRAAIPVLKGTELYARIENLFDERYETVYQYGSNGRAGYVGVRLRY